MPRKIEVEVVSDVDKYRKGLKSADNATSSFGSSLKGMGKMAGLAVGGAALGGLVVGLKSSIGAAKEAEQAQLRLEDAMKSANVSYKAHDKVIGETIQSVSRLAAVDDEDLSDAFAKLVRSSGDVKGSLEGMSLATDIAAARGISLEAATKAVEKAMNGNEQAFKRVGLEMAKNATAQETLAAAQERFGGAAAKQGQSAAAAQERLSIAFENLQEKIGQKLLPVFADLMTKLSEVVTWVEVNWPRIEAEFGRGMEKVRQVIDKIKPILKLIVEQVENIVRLVKAIIEGDWSEVWKQLKEIVVTALRLAWEAIKLWADTIGEALLNLAKGAVRKFAEGMKALPGVMADAIKALPGIILDLGGLMFNAAQSLGVMVVKGLASGLRGAAGAVAGGVSEAVRAAINYLIDRVNSALEITIPIPFRSDIHIDPPNIPHLATGGIVTRPTLAVVGEAGPEAVVPLGRGGGLGFGGGEAVIHTHVYLDGKQMFESVRREFLRFDKRNGRSAV